MSISFTYDPEKQIVYGVMVDTFTWDEYEAVVGEIAKSDNFRPDVGSLWDMRRFDFNSLDREMEEHAVGIRERFPARGRARLALLVDDEYGFAMLRMYEMLSERLPQVMKIFTSFDEAEVWLLEAVQPDEVTIEI